MISTLLKIFFFSITSVLLHNPLIKCKENCNSATWVFSYVYLNNLFYIILRSEKTQTDYFERQFHNF